MNDIAVKQGEEPIRLTVVSPVLGNVAQVSSLDDPRGYVVTNLALGLGVTHNPVRDIAAALESDGYSPHASFALLDPAGNTVFCGNIHAALNGAPARPRNGTFG